MATEQSNEYIRALSTPRNQVKVNEWGGRLRRRKFSFLAGTDGAGTNGDIIKLCPMYAGERMMGGRIKTTALGASVTGSFGDALATATTNSADGAAASATKFSAALAIAAIADLTWGDTIALLFGLEVVNNFDLCLTVGGATITSGQSFIGYVEYLQG